jgi:transcriptional regulator with XRE-family HTH domain
MPMQVNQERYETARRCGARLAQLRKERKLTLKQVGEKTGFSPQPIFLVEHGAINTPIETLARIATALGVPLGALAFANDATMLPHQSCLDQWGQGRPDADKQIVRDFLQWIAEGSLAAHS